MTEIIYITSMICFILVFGRKENLAVSSTVAIQCVQNETNVSREDIQKNTLSATDTHTKELARAHTKVDIYKPGKKGNEHKVRLHQAEKVKSERRNSK
jgi:hypothetical protein